MNALSTLKPRNILLAQVIETEGVQKEWEFRQVKPWLSGTDIRSMMRENNKTIAGVAAAWNITQKRVRYVREHGVTGIFYVMDWIQFMTGCTFRRTYSGDWIIVSSDIA